MPAFTVTVTLATYADSDEHLHTEQSIREEVRSWLESLRATVYTISVRQEENV